MGLFLEERKGSDLLLAHLKSRALQPRLGPEGSLMAWIFNAGAGGAGSSGTEMWSFDLNLRNLTRLVCYHPVWEDSHSAQFWNENLDFLLWRIWVLTADHQQTQRSILALKYVNLWERKWKRGAVWTRERVQTLQCRLVRKEGDVFCMIP